MSQNKTAIKKARPQSRGEEIANSVSHGIGLLAALISAPLLIITAARQGDLGDIVAMSIFATTMMFMYLTSTLYHALPQKSVKRIFRILDHCAIYLLIAGTYTPFTLGVLSGAWGWTLFGLVWSIALAGIILKAVGGVRYPKISTGLYLVMGWLVVIAVKPLWLTMPHAGLYWLLAGGIAYTAGVAFYATGDRVRYWHFIWHLFVIAGTVCHFVAVFKYAV